MEVSWGVRHTEKRELNGIKIWGECEESQHLHRTVASPLLLWWTQTKTPFEDTELILIIPVGLILRGQHCLDVSPPKKTHFSGHRIPDTVPLNCENSSHNGAQVEKKTPKRPQNPPSSIILPPLPPNTPPLQQSSHLGKQRSKASSEESFSISWD